MGGVCLRYVHVLPGPVEFCGGVTGGVDATRHDVEGVALSADGKELVGRIVGERFN